MEREGLIYLRVGTTASDGVRSVRGTGFAGARVSLARHGCGRICICVCVRRERECVCVWLSGFGGSRFVCVMKL